MAIRHVITPAATLALAAVPAMGAAHSWDVIELFSNADGTIQFVELREQNGLGNEINLNGLWVLSQTTGNQFFFPGNLPCTNCTQNRHLLLATSGFAALPGAPTPDYIIPDGFFDTTADTLQYYNYDTMSFTAGQLPLDGFNSLHDGSGAGANTPTNFDGESGTINLCPEDLDHDGAVSTSDLLDLLAAWGTNPGGPPDFDGDGVGTSDLLQLLASWGPCG